MRSAVGWKPGMTVESRSSRGWFTGLISVAVRAAGISRCRGKLLGVQTIGSLIIKSSSF